MGYIAMGNAADPMIERETRIVDPGIEPIQHVNFRLPYMFYHKKQKTPKKFYLVKPCLILNIPKVNSCETSFAQKVHAKLCSE